MNHTDYYITESESVFAIMNSFGISMALSNIYISSPAMGKIGAKEPDRMGNFVQLMIFKFFVAFGIVIGAALFGILGTFVMNQPLSNFVKPLLQNIKIWALVVALGGTIDPLRVIESNFLDGQLSPATKQLVFILISFMGAHMGVVVMRWLLGWEGNST
jgi:hypothetical protein